MKLDGVIIDILTHGSSVFSISVGSGNSSGLVIVSCSPLVFVMINVTPGEVTTRERENSRSKRSRTKTSVIFSYSLISMWLFGSHKVTDRRTIYQNQKYADL